MSTETLSLNKNPWSCTCDSRWLAGWLNSIKHVLTSTDDILCGSPSRLRGKNILMMTDADFCYTPPRDQRPIIIAVSTLAGCLVVAAIIFLLVYRLRHAMFRRVIEHSRSH